MQQYLFYELVNRTGCCVEQSLYMAKISFFLSLTASRREEISSTTQQLVLYHSSTQHSRTTNPQRPSVVLSLFFFFLPIRWQAAAYSYLSSSLDVASTPYPKKTRTPFIFLLCALVAFKYATSTMGSCSQQWKPNSHETTDHFALNPEIFISGFYQWWPTWLSVTFFPNAVRRYHLGW